MNKTLRFKSILLSMLAVLAISFTSLSLTSCSDDDDDNGGGNNTPAKTVIINGTNYSIDDIWVYYSESGDYWSVWLVEENYNIINIHLCDEFLGKENKLTDVLGSTASGHEEYSYIQLSKIDTKNYYCGDHFKSGTIKMSINESSETISISLKGETKDGVPFSANYSGPFDWEPM